jgi:MFS family permease
MADRFGPAPVLISGLPLGAFAVAVMAAVGPRPVVLVICLVLIGALSNGGQAITISVTAHYAEFIGGIGTGAALGVTRLAQSLGPAVAPSIVGYLFSHIGAPGAEIAIGSLFMVAAAVALAILPRLKYRAVGS